MERLKSLQELSRFLQPVLSLTHELSISLLILFCMLGTRADVLLQMFFLSKIHKLVFFVALGTSCTVLMQKQRKLLLIFITLWSLVLLHSFVSIFAPMLSKGSMQDFLLSPHVSAFWTFDLAKKEAAHLFGYALIACSVFLSGRDSFLKRMQGLLLFTLALNLLLAFIQGFVRLDFISEGSGTALGSGRVAGFMEDSGAFSCLLTMLSCGVLSLLAFAKLNSKRRVFCLVFLLSLLSLGILRCGRVYPLSMGLALGLLPLLKGTRKFRLAYMSLLLLLTSSVLWFYKESLLSVQTWESFDYQRTKHILAMLEAIRESFPFGKGLGSFQSFCENIALSHGWKDVFLDWPSSFYLQMLSELGLLGLCMLFMLAVLFFKSCQKAQTLQSLFILGSFTGLALTWTIGMQFIYSSIALLLGWMLASIGTQFIKNHHE